MGRQIKGLLYFFIMDCKRQLMIFWSILIMTLSVSLIIAYLLVDVEDMRMIFGIPFALYIFCGIFGFITVKQGIPFAIKMGATRKSIFASVGLFFIGLSIAKAIAASTLQTLFEYVLKGFSIDTYMFVHPAELIANTWITRVIIDATIMFLILSTMFLLGLVFYKYGLLGGGLLSGFVVIYLLLGVAKGWVTDFFIDVYQTLSLVFFYETFLVGIVLYMLSWALLRKITTVQVR